MTRRSSAYSASNANRQLQLKRISPGLGAKAAARDPVVELDIQGKSLGSDGFAELAPALIGSIDYVGEHGRVVKLEELCLRGR